MRKSALATLIVSLMALSACQGSSTPPTETPAPTTEAGTLKWYSTCGSPVCGNPNIPPGENTCGEKQEGRTCTTEGETCDLGNDCQQQLVCAKSDPKQQPGGCPISKAEYKQNIHVLNAQERQALSDKLLHLPLASWNYRFEPQGPTRIGFMIDANTPQELVKPTGDSVNLYGYMTLAAAAIQEQEKKVKALEARLHKLEQQLERCP